METFQGSKSSYSFRFSDYRPNPVSHIAFYFPGFEQDPELLKRYVTEKKYVDENIERSYFVTVHRIKDGQPRRFLSLQTLNMNVGLMMQQLQTCIDENKSMLVKVSLVGHSLGAIYARTCLLHLQRKYPQLLFELHELALPNFAWGVFLHQSFLWYGGFFSTIHALLLLLLNVVTLGRIVQFRGYRAPGFVANGLFLNNLADQMTADDIAKAAPPDATLAFFEAALCYGYLSSLRKSEVTRAREAGWNGKHFVYAARDDRVFRWKDIELYARKHGTDVIPLEPGYSERFRAKLSESSRSQAPVTHCPFY